MYGHFIYPLLIDSLLVYITLFNCSKRKVVNRYSIPLPQRKQFNRATKLHFKYDIKSYIWLIKIVNKLLKLIKNRKIIHNTWIKLRKTSRPWFYHTYIMIICKNFTFNFGPILIKKALTFIIIINLFKNGNLCNILRHMSSTNSPKWKIDYKSYFDL